MPVARLYWLILLLLLALASCKNDDVTPVEEIEDPNFPVPDWTEATHGKGTDPNYAVVFPQDKVNTVEIKMSGKNWTSIQENMKTILGVAFGAGGQGGQDPQVDPDYVAVSVKFNGLEWYKVGFRLKGNSSLKNSWRQGIYKLPFRLNLNKFEDDFPQIKGQRFNGFKELSMSPGANDNTLIREKAGADIFRAAGIPSSQTAFYKVFIDFGTGQKYCGVYTMVEVVDDTMIKKHFGSDKGNIYKPESSFQNFLVDQFEKKNNTSKNDFSDVTSTFTALHSGTRTSDAVKWRTDLEKVFNANQFIKWLAVNTVMLNWDTYGRMSHNYYLYNNASSGLTWIPWDNNESMFNRGNPPAPISLSNVGSNWPLIRYLLDDPLYQSKYKAYVKEFSENVFTDAKMYELFNRYHDLIAPHVIGPIDREQGKYTHLINTSLFTSDIAVLKQHVTNQNFAAAEFLK